MARKQIFLVYKEDVYPLEPVLIMCTTSESKLKQFISKKIEKDEADYNFEYGADQLPKKVQAKVFRDEFEKLTSNELNRKLYRITFDYVIDGEEI